MRLVITSSEFDAAYNIAADHERFRECGDCIGMQECWDRRNKLPDIDRVFVNVWYHMSEGVLGWLNMGEER